MRFLILLFTLPAAAHAQYLDSLRTACSDRALADSSRFHACYDLVWDGYLFSDPDSALILAGQLQQQARQKHSAKFDALAYDLQAAAWYVKGDLRKALSLYAVSLPMHEQRNDHGSVADVIGNMGSMHSYLGEHQQAMELYARGLAMHTRLKDTVGMANDINAMGRVLLVQGDHARAIDHFDRCLHMQQQLHNDRGIATGLTNLAAVHFLQGDYAAAREHYTEALRIAERLGDTDQAAAILQELGTCHQEMGDTAKAMELYREGMDAHLAMGDQRGIVSGLNKIAELLRMQHRTQEALAKYTEASSIATEHELPFGLATALIGAAHAQAELGRRADALRTALQGEKAAHDADDISLERDVAELLYRLHRDMGQHDRALVYHETFVTLRDSMMREENQREAIRNDLTYAQEKRMMADSLLRQEERLQHAGEVAAQRSRNHLLITALIIALLVATGIWARLRYMAHANRAIKAAQAHVVEVERQREAEAVRTRIARDIHDELGAELTKINLFGQEADRLIAVDPAGASLAVGRMGELSRRVSSSLRDLVHTIDPTADNATALVAHASDLCGRLLEGSGVKQVLDLHHEGAERVIDPATKRDLLLLLKEAINNALKHAQASTVRVRFHTDPNGFIVEVQDDGRGFDVENKATGHGLRYMHQRAAALGSAFNLRSEPNKGCHIAMTGKWPNAYYSRGIP